MLEKVKSMLGISGNYQDNAIQCYIDEVKQFMIDAGVSNDVVDSEVSIGVISRGVLDLWNYSGGDTRLSPYFYQRVIQLASKKNEQDENPAHCN